MNEWNRWICLIFSQLLWSSSQLHSVCFESFFVMISVIGYDQASSVAYKALEEKLTLREAAISKGNISPVDIDRIVVPAKMVGDPDKDLRALGTCEQ
jgi:aspartate ammonia-lyase